MPRTLTYDRAHALFALDHDTGALIRKATQRGRRGHAGARAGAARPDGYRQVSIDGRLYLEHHVVWLMVTGELPKDEIDHINRARNDNRPSNLRPATRAQNSQNRGGARGVCWDKEYGKWRAYIQHGGKSLTLGRFVCLGEALRARQEAKARLHDYAPVAS